MFVIILKKWRIFENFELSAIWIEKYLSRIKRIFCGSKIFKLSIYVTIWNMLKMDLLFLLLQDYSRLFIR